MVRLTKVALDVATTAIAARCNGGSLELRSAAGDRLATLRFASPAFATENGRVVGQVLDDDDAEGSGEPAAFVVKDRLGAVIFSGSVGLQHADLILDKESAYIRKHATVKVQHVEFGLTGGRS